MSEQLHLQDETKKTILPCGLRVVSQNIPYARSVSIGLWITVGSRDESPHEYGCAHFLEHLLFRGTRNRTATEIANTIDAIGGEFNAFTTKENTCFYLQVLEEDSLLGLDLICDVVLNGLCRKSDIEIERHVVLDEIAMQNDDPEDYISEQVLAGLYPNSSIARPILGSKDNITSLSAKAVKEFHKRWYTPNRMVLSVAGNIDHDSLCREVEQKFSYFSPDQPCMQREPEKNLSVIAQSFTQRKDGEQSHLCMAYPLGGKKSPEKITATILMSIIGGGISSRLFQKIREEQGLAYSVYSNLEYFTERGMFSIYMACQPKGAAAALASTRAVIQEIVKQGVSQSEVVRAKKSLKGSLILGLEDVLSRMFRLGRHEINYGEYRDISYSLQEIDAVSKADVNKLARKLFTQKPSIAFIGPIRGKKHRDEIIQLV